MDRLEERIQTMAEKTRAHMLALITKKGYIYIDGEYINQFSLFTIKCPVHGITKMVEARNFLRAIFGLSCCAYESPNRKMPSRLGLTCSPEALAKKRATEGDKRKEKMEALAFERQHVIQPGDYSNRKNEFIFVCFCLFNTQQKRKEILF